MNKSRSKFNNIYTWLHLFEPSYQKGQVWRVANSLLFGRIIIARKSNPRKQGSIYFFILFTPCPFKISFCFMKKGMPSCLGISFLALLLLLTMQADPLPTWLWVLVPSLLLQAFSLSVGWVFSLIGLIGPGTYAGLKKKKNFILYYVYRNSILLFFFFFWLR